MRMGPLLDDRSLGAEAGVVVVAPAVVGALAGVLAAETKPGYLILSLVAAIGAVLAGTEHRSAIEGAYRGLFAGLVYGVALLTVLELREKAPQASLPHHLIVVALISAIVSALLGALGGALRARALRRPA